MISLAYKKFCSALCNVRSKALNVRSKALNVRSKALNVRSKALNGLIYSCLRTNSIQTGNNLYAIKVKTHGYRGAELLLAKVG